MKQIAASLLATVLVIPTLAETTSLVDYGQITTSPPLELLWEFDRDTFNGVPCATITGVSVVTGEKNLTGDISVPESLVCADGTALVVKKIADGAFSSQIGITSISIPVTVEEIGSGVFTGCTVLGAISVDSGNSRFTSSNGVLYDKDLARIIACPARKETLHLPMTLKEIGVEAFADCHRLLSLNIPSSVTAIADRAFMDCTRLASVTFEGNAPTAADSIAQGANAGLVFYKKPESTGWDAAPWNSFNVQNAATEQPSGVTSATSGNVTWYYRVVTEGAESYAEIYNNDNEAIPKTTVQTYTYDPINFEWIPDGKLVIPSSLGGYTVKKIGDYAFSNCSALDSVSIPKSVRKIGNYAFAGCSSITSMEIPSEVKGIGYHPFSGTALTSLVLPDSLRDVDGNPLAGCDTFLSVSISPDNSYFTVVNGLLYDKDIQTLIGCPARMESVSIPSSTTVIGQEAFDGCFRLRTILLPDYLDSVGESAFRDATRLSSLVFPGLLKELKGPGLFENCSKLAFVGFTGNAPTVNPQLFSGAPASLIVYVAQGTTGWKDATTALPDSGKWPTDDGYGRAISNLDVSAEAELKEGDIFVGITTNGTTHYTYTLEVLANKGVKILGVSPKPVGNFEVPSAFDSSLGTLTVKTLGDSLFANSIGLLSVSIPNSVTAIGDEVFKDCNVLASVTLAHGLRSIGRHPFEGTAIETIAIPDTVSTIDGNIFFGCDPSVSLSVGANNPYFAESAEGALYDKDFTTLFAVPMTAEELTVPATATNIHDEAFANCIRLKAIAFLGNAPTAADDILADTPTTLDITIEEGSLGWDGDPTSSALPASGLWRDRAITVNAEPPVVDSNTDGIWKWTVNAGVATLYNDGNSALLDTNYNGAVSIPVEVADSATGNKYTVVALGDRAMYGCKYVTAVTLPTTIEFIGAEPFSGTKIATLSIPEYVAAVGGNPAAGCSRFTGFTVDAANIDFSADAAGFLYDAAGATLLAVPARATEIYVPASVTAIADDAFAGCAALAKVNFIGNAPTAANTIFADTPANMTSYAQASASGFTGDTWKGRPLVITGGAIGPTDRETIGGLTWYYRVVDGVAEIWRDGKTAVSSDSSITALALPATLGGYQVKGVGAGALASLRGITTISFPSTYEWIGDGALSNCTSLASVTLAHGLRSIGRHPFAGTAIETIALPDTVSSIDGNILYGCDPSVSLSIGDDNPRFAVSAEGALYDKDFTTLFACPMTAEEIELPATVAELADECFAGCIRLKKATFLGNAPTAADTIFADTPATMTNYAKEGAGFTSGTWKGRPIVIIPGIDITNIIIPETNTVGDIDYEMFWTYELHTNSTPLTATLKKLENAVGDVTIKNIVFVNDKLYTVTNIAAGAIADNPALLSVTVPNTILEIGDEAFRNCTSLENVALAYGIRYIGARAFLNTIVRELTVPDSLLDMRGNISAGTLFTLTLNIDDSSHFVYSDDGALFNRDMTKLYACPTRAEGTIILPETLTNICADAFFGCHRLTYLNIPASVTTIGDGAFNVAGIWPGLSAPESTPHLESIFYNGTKPNAADDIYAGTPETLVSYALTDEGWTGGETWKNRKVMVISGENPPVLSYIDSNRITWYYRIVNKEIEIYNEDKNHSPITAVSPRSTQGGLYNENDSTVYVHALRIPTSINGFAVTKIGPHAFDGCSALTLVGIPYSIREIGDFAFSNCTAIVSIDSVEEVPFGNYVVNTITLPTGVNKLGYHPFEGVQASSVSLPYTLTSTDGNPAAGCGFVSTLSVDDTNPSFYSTGNILYDKTKKKVIAVPPNFGETSVSFLPSVTEICNEALLNCRNLTTIQLPESLTSIEQMALSGCSSVAALSIPSNVTAIGSAAFSGCSSLLSVTYAGNAPTAPDDLYSGTLEALTSYASSEAEGFTEPTWKDRPIDFVPPPPPQPLIYIDGAGVAWGYQIIEDDIAEIISVSSESAITALTFPSTIYALTVKGVGAGALASQRGITAISFPSTYEWIGNGAFSNCTSLASVTLAHGLRSIGRHPFEGTAIESIALPDTVSSIDGNILYGCDPSVSLSVGDNNPYFAESEEGALYDKDFTTLFACPMTTEALAVPATTTNVNDDAFADCIRLASIAFLGDAPAAADGIFADTPETLVISVLDGSLGWDGDPTSSALPASGLWRDRTIVAQNHTDGTWTWVVDGDLATLYNGGDSALLDKNTSGEVVIPAEVTDSATGRKYTVVGIGDGAFSGCSKVTAVTLPDTIETIGAAPFAGTKISTLSIPAHVESIDGNPAAGCAYFTGFTVDEGNISFSADDGLLYNSTQTALLAVPARATDVTVPESVTSIADDAFAGCVALANVKFLGNAPTAADDVFADTPATLVISVLDGSLGWDGDPTSSALPASGLWRDRKIERAPGEATKYTDSTGTEWDVTIYDNKAELGANGVTPVIPASTSGEVTVPGEITIDGKTYTITSIPDGAFEGCNEITAVNIPASITTIAADAFNGCTSLESITVDSKNPAYSSRNGILYSKDGKTLVKVPAKTSFAATFTEQETATKKDIVEVIGSTDPTTMTTDPNQIIELKSYGTSTTTTTTEFFPAVSIDKILSGVTAISDYAFTDCGLMPEGSTVSGTMVVKVNGKETGRKTGTFELPVGTDSTGGHTNSYIYSQAGFYKGSVCLYHTANDSDRTVSYAIPINIPTGISYGNLAFYNSHFTSKNKSNASAPVPPPVVIDPPVDVPDDDSCDTNDGFGVTAILRDSNGNESAIKEGEVIEAHVGIKMSIPLSVGNAPDGSLSTVTAKGLPAGVKLAKTAVKEGRKVVKYIYAIEGTPSRAQSAKTVVLKVTNKKNKLNESVSFAIKVLAMPSWVGGKYNGVCFDGTTEIGSATATISAAGKLSGKIMVPSDDGKKALKLSYTAKGFSGFDEESNTFYGTATMRVNGQTVEVPFTLSAYDGAGQLSLELPGMTAALEQNTWKRGDIVATTIEVDGFKFKLAANGKVKWSGSVEGDNGSTLSVSGSTQLLSGPSALVYIPPKANLVGGWCQLFQLW